VDIEEALSCFGSAVSWTGHNYIELVSASHVSNMRPPVLANSLIQDLVSQNAVPQSQPHTASLPELLSQFKSQTSGFAMSSKVTCAAGSRGGAVLGLESGEVVHVGNALTLLGKHTGSVTCVAAVETLLVSGSEDCTVVLWSDCKYVGVLSGHQQSVSCVAFTPDTSKVVSGSFDQSLRVWSLCDLKEMACLRGHSSYVKCVTTTNDGHRAISGALDGCIIVWNIDSFIEEKRLAGHQRMIWCLTAWENYVVSGSWDNTLKLWDVDSWEEVASLPGLTRDGSKVPFTPDGRYLVCGSENNELKAWHVADPTIVETLKGHEGPITCVAVTPKYIVSGSEDCTLRVWSSDDMQVIATLQGHTDEVAQVVVTPDYKRVVSVGIDSSVRVWSIDDMNEVATMVGHTEQVTSLAVEGWRAVTGSVDKSVRVWDTQTMTTLAVLTGHTDRVNTVALSSDALTAVSGSRDRTLRTWDLTTFEEKLSFEKHTDYVLCCLLHHLTVISGSADKTIRLWHLDTGAELTVLRGHRGGVWCLALAPEGVLVSGSADCEIRLWRLETYEEIGVLTAHVGSVKCLAVTGDWLASGSTDKTIKVWSLSSKAVLFTLKGHTRDICSLAITSDSEFLLSGSEDATARIWSLCDMKELLCLPCHSACVSLAVSSRRALLASARLVSVINLDLELQPYRLSHFSAAFVGSEADYQDSYSLLCANVERLRTGQPVHLQVAAHIVYPHFFNSLHICAYYNHFERLAQYLGLGVPLLRGRFGSPLTVALERSTHKCIEVLLKHLLTCKPSVIVEVTEDLPLLLRSKSPFIAPFFDTLLRPTEQDELPQFISPVSPLPMVRFSPGTFIRAEDFGLPHELTNTEVVEFQVSVFRWNFSIGCKDSVTLLRALEQCTDSRVLTTELVSTLIEQKWQALWLLTLGMTTLYVILLLTLVCMQFSKFSLLLLKPLFVVLNVFFLAYEGVQAVVSGKQYLRDAWNSVDIVRGILALVWIIQVQVEQEPREPREHLHFLVVALCFVRGFTFFRTFKMTRLFVRMTLEVIKEIYSFLAILLYSTFAFGLMYSSLNPVKLDSLGKAWAVAYELIMGQFNNSEYEFTQWLCFTVASLLNVIIMLNLLISILGDAYERAQMSAKENDLSEMLRLVIEYESMLIWRRACGQPCVVIKCCSNNGAAVTDEWEGRLSRMIKGVNEEISGLEGRLNSRMDGVESRLQIQLAKVEGKLEMLVKALSNL